MLNPDAFCRFMRSLLNESLAQKVQPENIELVNKSFLAEKIANMDLIYKISIDIEYKAYFHILMEFQSSSEKSMALRVLNYICQFWLNRA